MCDLNIRDTQRGEREKEGTQRGPEGPRVIRQLHTNLEKVIPLWPVSTSAMCDLTYRHPFSVHRSSTYGPNYYITLSIAALYYTGHWLYKSPLYGGFLCNKTCYTGKAKQRKCIPSDAGGTQQKEKENMDKIKNVTEKFSVIQSW